MIDIHSASPEVDKAMNIIFSRDPCRVVGVDLLDSARGRELESPQSSPIPQDRTTSGAPNPYQLLTLIQAAGGRI